ncbi:MAG TPA: hypothetical protein VH592_10720 [Gemmataceae bacterium]|jgi:aspartokinase-like uncharacterized kinase
MPSSIAVVKVGGSLYDLPDLGPRLRCWLAQQFTDTHVVVIPGGGPLADSLRHLDRLHRLGEENAHWLALRALTVNAHFLASLLPQASVIDDVSQLGRAWENNRVPVLDVHEFARNDEKHPNHLPHSWSVTSDSLSARVAVVLAARHLVLLKSTIIPPEVDWGEAGQLGLVDALFAKVLHDAPADLRVRAVNLRM